jgi:hypothetical protein
MNLNLVVFFSAFSAVSCVPTIVVIDRTTLIEEESSGAWPDFDAQLNQQALDFRPSVLPPSENDKRNERAYKVIDGDYSLTTQSKK